MMKSMMIKELKQVQFSDVTIFNKVCSCEEHKSARSGLVWIQAAADRQRFHMRIQKTSLVLNNVIEKKLKQINV